MLPAAVPCHKGTMLRTLCGRFGSPGMRSASRAVSGISTEPRGSSCAGVHSSWAVARNNVGDGIGNPGRVARARCAAGRLPVRVAVAPLQMSISPSSLNPKATCQFATQTWRPNRGPRITAAAAEGAMPKDDSALLELRRTKLLASLPSVCPGCGVGLQCADQNLPGFFVVPERLLREEDETDEETEEELGEGFEMDESLMTPEERLNLAEAREMELLGLEDDDDELFELGALEGDEDDDDDFVISDAMDSVDEDDDDVYVEDDAIETFVIPGDFDDSDFFEEGWLDDLAITVSEEDEYVSSGDGGGMRFGMGNYPDSNSSNDDSDEDVIAPGSKEAFALAALGSLFDDDGADAEEESDANRRTRNSERKKINPEDQVTCARCFSLRNYGVVKNQAAETLMPSFDFKRVIGGRLDRLGKYFPITTLRRLNAHTILTLSCLSLGPGGAVVLLVIDVVDFDASFPTDAVDALHPYILNETIDVLLVANKVDLLPTQCTRTRVASFARRRAKALGLERAAGVHLVSAHTGMGTNVLSDQLEQLLQNGAEAWVVGAQNAGKSSLINRLSQKFDVDGKGIRGDVNGGPGVGPIASHLPGTTLGVVRLPNLLPGGADIYDTPGLLQPQQVSSRLTSDEARAVLPRRRLTPRTYRAEIGSTIHIGGLGRIDVLDGPQRTMYLTVWASADIPTHYMLNGFAQSGKAATLYEKHAGAKLFPPIGPERVGQLGEWGSRVVTVFGTSWQKSDRDVVIGGLGWVGVGVNGEATLRVWTHEGVMVETREALVPDMARDLHRPGFSDEMSVGGGAGDGGKRPSKRVTRKGPGRGRG